MVDTATTKAVPAAPANASRQGYWRGVLRRLLRDPGGVVARKFRAPLAHNPFYM